MPQALTVPSWYNDNNYINEKVKECNTIKFGDQSDWNADSVKAALAGAFGEETYAAWMGYENFVSNGNAENCSPSPYFVVAEYLAAKAAQLNDIKYEDKTDWDQVKVLDAFKAANISAWDHYTKYGQAEGLNPSNAFDTSSFFEAKCEILNAWENEDGTTGYEGNTDWTPQEVVAVFQGLNINPIMNQPENPDAASLIIAVPTDEQVSGGNFNPWGPAAPTEYNDIPLVAGEHEFIGTEGNDNFIGDILSSTSKSTLQRDDVIDGKGGDDMLTVAMNGNWAGFSSKGGMSGVETINLNNTTGRSYNFDTSGIEDAQTYNLKGAVNLSDLSQTGITINMADIHATNGISLGFAKGVTSGPADALTIGVENVYVPSRSSDQPNKAVDIKAAGIEDLTINATGTTLNQVNLDDASYMRSLAVTGDGNIVVEANGTDLTKIDAAEATGDVAVEVNTNGRASSPQITSAVFGAGNDTLTTNVAPNANIDGGDGNDAVIIAGAAGGYGLTTNSIEEVGIANNTSNVTLIGAEMDGVETLSLSGTRNGVNGKGIVLGEFANTQLNVQAENSNTANLTIADISDITLRVGDGLRSTNDSFFGDLTLDATSLTISADDGVEQGAEFNGEVDADNVMDLALHTGRNSFVTIQGGSDLSAVSNITATGYGTVNIQDGASLAANAQNVYVDTRQMTNGQFNAVFNGNTEGADLDILGGNLTDHNIFVGAGYSSINVETGMGNDSLTLISSGNGSNFTSTTLEGNLGGGSNNVEVRGNVSNADFSNLTGVTRFIFTDNSYTTAKFADDFKPVLNDTVLVLGDGVGGSTNVDIPQNASNWTVPIPSGATSVTVNGTNAGNLNSINVPTSTTPVTMNYIKPAGDSFSISSGSDSTFNNPDFSDLTSLNLTTTNPNAGIDIVPAAGKSMCVPDLNELNVSGSGDINLNDQVWFGVANTTEFFEDDGYGPALTVNANNLSSTGSFSGAVFDSAKLDYNGGDGNESIQVILNNTGNDIDLGKGADTVLLQFFDHSVNGSGSLSTATVNLGTDSDQDTVGLMSGGGWNAAKSNSLVTVNGFVAKQDILQRESGTSNDGLTEYYFGKFMAFAENTTEQNAAQFLNKFGLGLEAEDIKAVGREIVYAEHNGTTNAYAIYYDGANKVSDGTTFGGASPTDPLTATTGMALIELVGVDDITLTTVAALSGNAA